MAKKKRKKRPQTRPQTSGVATRPRPATAETPSAVAPAAPPAPERPSNRQLRKEQARIERERRLKLARRRLRMRRFLRVGIPLLVIAAVVAFFVYRNIQQARALAEARTAISCGEVETQQDELDAFAALGNRSHAPPFVEGQGGLPATAGAHTNALPPEPRVYDQPVPEANAVHNLEHGYVLIYYAGDGEDALADDLVARLEAVANDGTEVILSPYEGLAEPLALVSWGRLQTCAPPANADPDHVETVARGFIDEYMNSSLAPEASS